LLLLRPFKILKADLRTKLRKSIGNVPEE